jgi:hypothetical protein
MQHTSTQGVRHWPTHIGPIGPIGPHTLVLVSIKAPVLPGAALQLSSTGERLVVNGCAKAAGVAASTLLQGWHTAASPPRPSSGRNVAVNTGWFQACNRSGCNLPFMCCASFAFGSQAFPAPLGSTAHKHSQRHWAVQLTSIPSATGQYSSQAFPAPLGSTAHKHSQSRQVLHITDLGCQVAYSALCQNC